MKNNLKNNLKNILPENFVNVLRFIGFCIGIAAASSILILFIAVLFRLNSGLFLPNSILDFFAFVLLLLLGSGLMFYLRRSGYPVKVLYIILLGFIAPSPYFIIYTYIILLLDFAFFPLKNRQAPEPPAVSFAEKNMNFSKDESVEKECSEESEEVWDESITQQLTRRKTADGKEQLEGTVLAEFADGQQTASIHIPFCPPFEKEPAVEAYLLEETDAAVSVGQSQVFGVRFDVKRKSKTAAKTVRFAFVAE